jgi:hypothetical protein
MVAEWARQEMRDADFGDLRLNGRVAVLVSALGARPNLSIPAACCGRAEMTAAYRFFDNDRVTFEKVLEPHIGQTRLRMAEQKVVVLATDTTEVDLTRPNRQVTGAGHLDGVRRGVFLHELHAFTPQGTPLGTVWAKTLNRTEGVITGTKAEKRKKRHQKPIEDKESMRWVEGLRAARDVASGLPHVHCICVSDSESDIYECITEPRGTGGGPVLDWVIRAAGDRALEPGEDGPECGYVKEAVLATDVLYKAQVKVRAREAKTATEKSPRGVTRRARTADVEVRAAAVVLRPPARPGVKLLPVTVNAVLVHEPNPPAGEPPIQWLLLTTLPIGTPEQVKQAVDFYCVRWNIEVFFRVLKSGCRIEHRRFEDVSRTLPALAMYMINAWRTLLTSRLGRECPDADCELLFEPSEWKAVWSAVHGKKPPKKRPNLSAIVHLVAQLGGYVERPSSEPGPQTIWIGLQRMYDLAWAWDAFGPGATEAGGKDV